MSPPPSRIVIDDAVTMSQSGLYERLCFRSSFSRAMAAAAEAEKWTSVAAEAVAEARNLAAAATEAAAEAMKWVSVGAEASAEGENWASVVAKAAAGEDEPCASVVEKAIAELYRCTSVMEKANAEVKKHVSVASKAASESKKWSSVAISAAARRRSIDAVSQDNGCIKKGSKEEKGEEDLVVTNPKLASLIYHCFNIAFLLQVILFMAHVLVYYNASDVWWHAVVATAIVSPLLIAPLYFTPILRDVFIRAYAMAPSNTCISDLSGKLLLSEKV